MKEKYYVYNIFIIHLQQILNGRFKLKPITTYHLKIFMKML